VAKDLLHFHALVAVAFKDAEARRRLVDTLAGRANLDATAVETYTHDDGRPAAVIHLRYRARGANLNDMPRRLAAAASASKVAYEIVQEPRGFAIRRPELEEDHPPPARAEPTDPVRADWSRAVTAQDPDTPIEAALRVELAGPVDDVWLAAFDDVTAATDALDAAVVDSALYVPDPWRGESVLTQAGEPRQTLQEAVTKFLNLVNDQWQFRVGRPDAAADTFEALTATTLAWPQRPHYDAAGGLVIWPYERDGRRGFTSAAVAAPGWVPWPQRGPVPPATRQERDAQIDRTLADAAGRMQQARRDGADRAAVLFPSWVGDERWLVAHVVERSGRSATWQAPLPEGWDGAVDWQEVPDRGRFGALAAFADDV
jgi:hypothetical protein